MTATKLRFERVRACRKRIESNWPISEELRSVWTRFSWGQTIEQQTASGSTEWPIAG